MSDATMALVFNALATIFFVASIPLFVIGVWLLTHNKKRETERAARDAMVYGVGILRDGKRIDPREFYKPPSQESK